MIDEVRIGTSPNDARGSWARPGVGASVVSGFGRSSDPGPNFGSVTSSDQFQNCVSDTASGMGCNGYAPATAAGAKSRHTGGVSACFADGSVRFVANSVSTPTWFRLHSRMDGQTITNGDY